MFFVVCCLLSVVCCLLFIVVCFLLVVVCCVLLFVVRCLLLVVGCWSVCRVFVCVACYLLLDAGGCVGLILLYIGCGLMCVFCVLLFDVVCCCLLFVVCCSLFEVFFVGWCLMFVFLVRVVCRSWFSVCSLLIVVDYYLLFVRVLFVCVCCLRRVVCSCLFFVVCC